MLYYSYRAGRSLNSREQIFTLLVWCFSTRVVGRPHGHRGLVPIMTTRSCHARELPPLRVKTVALQRDTLEIKHVGLFSPLHPVSDEAVVDGERTRVRVAQRYLGHIRRDCTLVRRA